MGLQMVQILLVIYILSFPLCCLNVDEDQSAKVDVDNVNYEKQDRVLPFTKCS